MKVEKKEKERLFILQRHWNSLKAQFEVLRRLLPKILLPKYGYLEPLYETYRYIYVSYIYIYTHITLAWEDGTYRSSIEEARVQEWEPGHLKWLWISILKHLPHTLRVKFPAAEMMEWCNYPYFCLRPHFLSRCIVMSCISKYVNIQFFFLLVWRFCFILSWFQLG